MIYVNLPEEKPERLSFYLAMEEYIAKRKKNWDDCFWMWQVSPSVIFGRNQLIENEVNRDFCRQHHINIYRRKSGGGCVYADMGNIMLSYINSSKDLQFTFYKYVQMVAALLQRLGVEAHANNRNDVMIGDKKVSGNAFYHTDGRNIVHGTLLYDTTMENMVGSITPSNEKLVSKGVKSVRQHIVLLKNILIISIEELKDFIRNKTCDNSVTLSQKDVLAIRKLEQEYLAPDFIFGNNPKYTVFNKKRIEGCGEFECRIELKNNIIQNVNLMGDFLLVGALDDELLPRLKGVAYNPDDVNKALEGLETEKIILNLGKDSFINLLFSHKS